MTTQPTPSCEDVQMAALARMDGERADIASDDVDRHVAACQACQARLQELGALHTRLERHDFEGLNVDLWAGLEGRIYASSPPMSARQATLVLALMAGLVCWRLAQLLLDLPAPVVNSVVPLVLVVVVLRKLARDPFAIRIPPRQLSERSAS